MKLSHIAKESEKGSDSVNLDILYKYIDKDYLKSLSMNVLDFIDEYYFRSRFVNFETDSKRNNPEHPLIYISNHSGMSFPWDAIIFVGALFRKKGRDINNSIRALTAPALSASRYMEPFMIEEFWKRSGGVDATLENFDSMMHLPESDVLIYPEGIAGIGKGFDKRYQLQRFSSSFIRMAIKYKTDIIPVSVVNGEFTNPYSYNNDVINQLANKIGIPYVPIGPITPFAINPWAFYFGLPAKLTYVKGNPIKVYEMIDKPLEKIKKVEMHHIRDSVQNIMQKELSDAVAIYGRDPFELEELGDIWRDNLDKIMYILPTGWPLLFEEHERLYRENKVSVMDHSNESFLKALIKNPMMLYFSVPLLGWYNLLKWRGVF